MSPCCDLSQCSGPWEADRTDNSIAPPQEGGGRHSLGTETPHLNERPFMGTACLVGVSVLATKQGNAELLQIY